MLDYVLTAIALLLVMEGIIPFLSPGYFRRFMIRLVQQTDKQLRGMGFILMIAGVGLMYFVHAGIFD